MVSRFLLAVFTLGLGIFIFNASYVQAQNQAFELPLSGDMARLRILEKPLDMPNLVFVTPSRQTQSLHELRGNLVILNMWATWCPPCIRELPALNNLQQDMQETRLRVLAVSVDAENDLETLQFLQENHLDYLQPYIDRNGDLMRLDHLRGLQGIPVTLIIDPQSRLLATYQGEADWNGTHARAMIDYYMANLSFVPFDFSKLPR